MAIVHRSASVVLAILISAIVLVLRAQVGYAQDSEIKAAIEGYHAAIESLDISKMEPLWVHESGVILVNPQNKNISVGWDAVKKNWEGAFNFFSEIKITQLDGPYTTIKDDVAWSTGISRAIEKSKAGAGDIDVFETDVFEKRDGRWLLVSHSARSIPK